MKLIAKITPLLLLAVPAFAGFTPGERQYEFAAEYEYYTGKNDLKGNMFEVSNEFGVTKDTSLGFNVLHEKIEGVEGYRYFETYHKASFDISNEFTFGFRNLLRAYTNNENGYNLHYEFRAMLGHEAGEGFYKNSRIDLAYRKRFKAYEADILKNELHLNFRLYGGLDLLSRLETEVAFGSREVEDEATNLHGFKNGNLKIANSTLYVGPAYNFKNGASIYVQGKFEIGGKASEGARGVFVGYSQGFNL